MDPDRQDPPPRFLLVLLVGTAVAGVSLALLFAYG